MSTRLYDQYYNAIKDKLPSIMKFKKNDKKQEKSEPLCITIPLKEGKEETPLTQEFVNVLQHEYAVRYLEKMGVVPTQNIINQIKKKIPLRNCDIKAGWSHTG